MAKWKSLLDNWIIRAKGSEVDDNPSSKDSFQSKSKLTETGSKNVKTLRNGSICI